MQDTFTEVCERGLGAGGSDGPRILDERARSAGRRECW